MIKWAFQRKPFCNPTTIPTLAWDLPIRIMSGEGLKAGNMGKIIRQESGWLEVQWYDAKRGWVPREVVLCIDKN
jgi:hypothetical protein